MTQYTLLTPELAPNIAYLSVVFPPENDRDSYTFNTFIKLYEAFCELKQWNDNRTKTNHLRYYLRGRALHALSYVLNHFQHPTENSPFKFVHVVAHMNLLLHVDNTEWHKGLQHCKCQYCFDFPYYKKNDNTKRPPSKGKGRGRGRGYTPASPPCSPYFSGSLSPDDANSVCSGSTVLRTNGGE